MRLPEPLARAAVAKWERSRAFHPGTPDQTVRLVFSAADFPDAWGLGGHEARTEILRAAETLQAAGLARLQFTGRGAFATPKAVVLLPEAVEAAYGEIRSPTRRAHLVQLIEEVERIPTPTLEWVARLFDRLREDLAVGRTAALGRKGGDPESAAEIRDALRLLPRIAKRRAYEERMLSGNVFGSTKRMKEIRTRLRHLLLTADPHWEGKNAPDDRRLFGHYKEVFKPPFTAIALGAQVAGLAHFARFRPYAVLGPDQMREIAAALAQRAESPWITTIENESAFLRYLEEPGVRERIEAEDEVVIYTEGYAAEDVTAFLKVVGPRSRGVRHWGDTDVEGYRIALILAEAAGEGALFRADAAWVAATDARLGQEIDAPHRAELEAMLSDARLPCCRGAKESIEATLACGIWLEQEVYYAVE